MPRAVNMGASGKPDRAGAASQSNPQAVSSIAAIPSAWEYFCDVGYFDMWCVRQVGSRKFGEGFHVINERSARELCDYLNEVGGAYGETP